MLSGLHAGQRTGLRRLQSPHDPSALHLMGRVCFVMKGTCFSRQDTLENIPRIGGSKTGTAAQASQCLLHGWDPIFLPTPLLLTSLPSSLPSSLLSSPEAPAWEVKPTDAQGLLT